MRKKEKCIKKERGISHITAINEAKCCYKEAFFRPELLHPVETEHSPLLSEQNSTREGSNRPVHEFLPQQNILVTVEKSEKKLREKIDKKAHKQPKNTLTSCCFGRRRGYRCFHGLGAGLSPMAPSSNAVLICSGQTPSYLIRMAPANS